jgi:hypothetical protein
VTHFPEVSEAADGDLTISKKAFNSHMSFIETPAEGGGGSEVMFLYTMVQGEGAGML